MTASRNAVTRPVRPRAAGRKAWANAKDRMWVDIGIDVISALLFLIAGFAATCYIL